MLFEIQNDEYWNGKSSKVNPEIIGDVPLLQGDDSGNEQTTDNTIDTPAPGERAWRCVHGELLICGQIGHFTTLL